MEAVIFIGIQGSGKSTFYHEKFFDSHVRINLDMLRTRKREAILLHACISAKQSFVIDNTNLSRELRLGYITIAKQAGFRVSGYFFSTSLKEALARNALRKGKARIPPVAVAGALKRMESPELDEGFDELYRVTIDSNSNFLIQAM